MGELTNLVGGVAKLWGGYKLARSGLDDIVRWGEAVGWLESSTGRRGSASTHKVRSLDDQIRILQRLIRAGRVDPVVIDHTGKVLSRKCDGTWCVREKDVLGELKAIFNEVRAKVRYQRDPAGGKTPGSRVDVYKSARRTLLNGFGDCANSVVVLASMFNAAGYPTQLRVVSPKGAEDEGELHVYVRVQNPDTGRWYGADAAEGKYLGWEPAASRIEQSWDFPTE